jgi:hypothetical protein
MGSNHERVNRCGIGRLGEVQHSLLMTQEQTSVCFFLCSTSSATHYSDSAMSQAFTGCDTKNNQQITNHEKAENQVRASVS